MTKITPREPVPPTPRGSMTPKRRLEVLLKCDGKCAKCGVKVGRAFIVDHILPLDLQGRDELGNLEILCIPCDKGKTKGDHKRIAKMRRQSKLHDEREPSRLQGRGFSKDLRKLMNGTVERRNRVEDGQ